MSIKSINQIDLDPQFKKVLSLLEETNKNFFITGKAGTGKSTLLDFFCQNTQKNPVVLAPTGMAALNVKGQTIHRFFNFYIDVTIEKIQSKKIRPRRPGLYKRVEMIIIDEVSMLRSDLLDCIDAFLGLYGSDCSQPFGGVQMVFVGDLYQLPPVVGKQEKELFKTHYETPYFFSAKALESIELEGIELKKVYRQKDEQFVNLLNKIRDNSVDAKEIERLNQRCMAQVQRGDKSDFMINLTSTNSQADGINARQLETLSGEKHTYEAEICGEFGKEYYPTAVELEFKVGAQIMLLNNDPKNRWVNGTIGVIESIDWDREKQGGVSVRLFDDEQVEIEPFKWEVYQFSFEEGKIVSNPVGTFEQYPFRLAWAITIHKSQGKTFQQVTIDIGRGTFACGQAYVALSRCTSLEGIQLKVPIQKWHILVDSKICHFLSRFSSG